MHKCLQNGFIGILEFDVFTDEADADLGLRVFEFVQEGFPCTQFRLMPHGQPHFPQTDHIELFAHHGQRHFVDGRCISCFDDGFLLYVAEQCDLTADLRAQGMLCPADNDIRIHSVLTHQLDAVLSRLGLQFLRGSQVRDQGQVHHQAVLIRKFPLQLTHRLNEGQAFDVTHCSADLRDHDVISLGSQQFHATFDLIGDMWDHLNGFAQVGPFPFFVDDRLIDLAGGDVIRLGRWNVQESLVMTQIQVGLRSVFRNVALSMLVWVQGTGVDVDIWVELLDRDREPARLQEFGE